MLDHLGLGAGVVDEVEIDHLLDLEDLNRQAGDNVGIQR
jgi:hypothetical protein